MVAGWQHLLPDDCNFTALKDPPQLVLVGIEVNVPYVCHMIPRRLQAVVYRSEATHCVQSMSKDTRGTRRWIHRHTIEHYRTSEALLNLLLSEYPTKGTALEARDPPSAYLPGG